MIVFMTSSTVIYTSVLCSFYEDSVSGLPTWQVEETVPLAWLVFSSPPLPNLLSLPFYLCSLHFYFQLIKMSDISILPIA